MSWARFDDRYHDNRKIKRAWRRHPRAVGLHAMAVTYCSMHETDGWVDEEWLEDKLPAKADREKCLAALTEVGLFEAHETGDYRVHDFLDYNHSKEEKDAQREQKATRQRKWRETRRSSSRDASTDASTGASRDASRDDAPNRPDPTLRPPRPPAGGRKRSQDLWKEKATAWALSVGVVGEREAVLRAMQQAKPWECNGDAREHFRSFVDQHFESLTAEAPA